MALIPRRNNPGKKKCNLYATANRLIRLIESALIYAFFKITANHGVFREKTAA
jgi:hypothetical protein